MRISLQIIGGYIAYWTNLLERAFGWPASAPHWAFGVLLTSGAALFLWGLLVAAVWLKLVLAVLLIAGGVYLWIRVFLAECDESDIDRARQLISEFGRAITLSEGSKTVMGLDTRPGGFEQRIWFKCDTNSAGWEYLISKNADCWALLNWKAFVTTLLARSVDPLINGDSCAELEYPIRVRAKFPVYPNETVQGWLEIEKEFGEILFTREH